MPVGGDGSRHLSLCIGCGDFALADALVNIALFVPLGLAFALGRGPPGRALVWIVLTTVTVETLQYVVVRGRTASVSDVIANTIGGALGLAAPRVLRWVLASATRAARATSAAAGAIALVVAAALALQTIHPPPSLHWTRHAPVLRRGFEPFTGLVSLVQLGGKPFAEGESRALEPHDFVKLGIALRSAQPPERLAEVAQFWTAAKHGWLWIDQRGTNLRTHVTSRADDWRLRGHATWASGSLPALAGESVLVRIALQRFRYDIEVEHGGAIMKKIVTVSPGDGWRLLVPFERQRQRERWSFTLTALWVGALLFPLGLFAQRHSRKLLVGAGIGAAVYFTAVPLLVGCTALSLVGWVGGAGGYAIGAAAATTAVGDWVGRVNAWVGAETG